MTSGGIVGSITASVGMLSASSKPVSADFGTYPSKSWEKSEVVDNEGVNRATYRSVLGHGCGWFGAEYLDIPDHWRHYLKYNSSAATKNIHDDGSQGWKTSIEVHGTGMSVWDTETVLYSYQPNEFGVTPAPSDGDRKFNWSDGAKEMATVALSAVSPYVDTLMTAASIADELLYDKSPGDNYAHEDRYEYGYDGWSREGETSHHRRFEVGVATGASAYIDINSYLSSNVARNDLNTNLVLYFEGGSDPTQSIGAQTASTTNEYETTQTEAGTTLFRNNEGWLIEKIPPSKIRTRGQRLGWSKKHINDRVERNKPVYWAHDAPVYQQEN